MIFPIPINMVSGGGLAEGREIRLGALVFIADDSAWLQEAPLDVDALPAVRRRKRSGWSRL